MKAIIIGSGIGGLTTSLFLNKHGIDCEVFEQAPAIQELGVGISLMPQAIASFDEIGMLAELEQSGIAPHHLFYRTGQGLTVWDEPRGCGRHPFRASPNPIPPRGHAALERAPDVARHGELAEIRRRQTFRGSWHE
jgi:2-polyprenyl-6-methoxyphenol hydroxylase-like FAD-dependent oxidoreductase